MSQNSSIEWTDHTASPWHGCEHGVYIDAGGNEHEHPGCAHCYAERQAKRNPGVLGVWGKEGTRVRSALFVSNCLRWNKQAGEDYERWKFAIENFQGGEYDAIEPFHWPTVFPSICDPLEAWGGAIEDSRGVQWFKRDDGSFTTSDHYRDTVAVTMDDLRRELFQTVDACQNLRFLLLTKRPQNIRKMWVPTQWVGRCASFPNCDHPDCVAGRFRANVCLLTSVSDQATADAFTDDITACSDLCAAVGISLEPMLGPVKLSERFLALGDRAWVIVGGESGHGARPMHPDWVRSIRDQCVSAGVPFFFKQWGEWLPVGEERGKFVITGDGSKKRIVEHNGNSALMERVGKKAAGRIIDGRTWDEMPVKREAVPA